MIYKSINISYKTSEEYPCYVEYTCYNKTIEEAMKLVRDLGYKEPKWYEFWKIPASVLTTTYDD